MQLRVRNDSAEVNGARLIKSLWKSLNTVWLPMEFHLISMEFGRNSVHLQTFLLTMRLRNTGYSSKINSNIQHFFHNWKTGMWSSDCINTHSAIRKVSKREMKNGTGMEEWKKGGKCNPAVISKKWPKGTGAVNSQVWENSSHACVKTTIILSLSCLNIRPTFV